MIFKAFFSEKYPLEKCHDYKPDNDVKSTTTASKLSHGLLSQLSACLKKY